MTAHIFDTEVNKLEEPEIIEAAWIKFESPQTLCPVDEFVCRYQPEEPITNGAMAVHHIMDEDLVDCPPSWAFKLPDDVEYLVGHNIDFDWRAAGEPDVKRICTLALSRSLWPGIDTHNLTAMHYFLADDQEAAREHLRNAHNAMADVETCREVLIKIIDHLHRSSAVEKNELTWQSLWEISEAARIPTVMPFGKHKGEDIKNVPASYRNWLLGQSDVDPYLRQALEGRAS